MIHRELRKRSVTLMLLWGEYRHVYVQGYGYSQFCDRYRRFKGCLSPTSCRRRAASAMRQRHAAGERMFVDYAGQTIEIVDGLTSEVHEAYQSHRSHAWFRVAAFQAPVKPIGSRRKWPAWQVLDWRKKLTEQRKQSAASR